MTDKHYDVFLSYSRKDVDTMQKIYADLTAAGLRVWVDKTGIPIGSPNWRLAIQAAIESSACLIVILSPTAKESSWVNEELSYAQTHEKPVYAIFASGEQKTAVPFGFSANQWADIRKNYQVPLNTLIDTVKQNHGNSLVPKSEIIQEAPTKQAISTVRKLTAWNPLHWFILLYWLYIDPAKYIAHESAYGKPDRVAAWLTTTLLCGALALPLISNIINPTLVQSLPIPISYSILLLLSVWLVIGIFGDVKLVGNWQTLLAGVLAFAGTITFVGAFAFAFAFASVFAVTSMDIFKGEFRVIGESPKHKLAHKRESLKRKLARKRELEAMGAFAFASIVSFIGAFAFVDAVMVVSIVVSMVAFAGGADKRIYSIGNFSWSLLGLLLVLLLRFGISPTVLDSDTQLQLLEILAGLLDGALLWLVLLLLLASDRFEKIDLGMILSSLIFSLLALLLALGWLKTVILISASVISIMSIIFIIIAWLVIDRMIGKNLETKQTSNSSKIVFALMIAFYAALIWLYFFGGVQLLGLDTSSVWW